MERGDTAGHIRLTEEDKTIGAKALRADGYPESAEVLENIGHKEIPCASWGKIYTTPGELMIESLKKLAERGHTDAQALVDSYQEIAIDFPNSQSH